MQAYASLPLRSVSLGGMVTIDVHAPPLALAQIGGDLGPWLGLGLVMLGLVALLVAGSRWMRSRRRAAQHQRPDPLLVFPMPGGQPRQPAPLATPELPPEASGTPLPPPAQLAGAPPVPEVQEVQIPPDRAIPASREPPASPAAQAPPPPLLPHPAHPGGNGQSESAVSDGDSPPWLAPPAGAAASESDGELVDGRTIRYYRPIDGNLQLLPGRLEIVEGEDRGQDIRFVRIRGMVPEVTFGRNAGPPHRHVQLRARTVSREHARMNFDEERWWIHNLSRTNPIVVNGRELDPAEEALTLKDGDLIEMGEVVFRFHEHG